MKNINKQLDEMVEAAEQINKELGDEDFDDGKPDVFERKMRFPDGDGDAEKTLWIARRMPREYNFEELALGRMILNARGEELPDAMESRFQSLSDQTRKYTMTTTGTGTGAELVDTVFYKPAGEGQAVTATDLPTAKRTLTAYTLKAQVDVSDEETEDAVVNMLASSLPFLYQKDTDFSFCPPGRPF